MRAERHDLVWIAPGACARVRAVDPARGEDVARWLALGRPAVATRRPAGLDAGLVALGVALPVAQGRARIALVAARDAIARVAPPLPLAAALEAAPPAWRAPLARLDAEARAGGLVPRVFGSLAWQRLTGEVHLRDGSDVDLLLPGATPGERARALALLSRWAGHATPRLDGELLLGEGRAVAWRELLAAPPRVLVKSGAGVSLEATAAALAGNGP